MLEGLITAGRAETIDAVIERWQWRLGLVEWTARRERISTLQVVDETDMPGNELVGVVVEASAFTIVHTRDLTEHDVIHELLHVAFPHWEHDQVELWTDLLDNPSPALTDFREGVRIPSAVEVVDHTSPHERRGTVEVSDRELYLSPRRQARLFIRAE